VDAGAEEDGTHALIAPAVATVGAMTALADRMRGPVLVPIDAGFAPELSAFNLEIVHMPDLVAGALDDADVVEAVRYARAQRMPIAVQGAGHGAYHPIRHGLAITTKRIDHVRIDPSAQLATIGAGTQWSAVIAAAAEHGLAPITGSGPTVGVVGFLLGGGLGPLARSHGFGSDYLAGARVVTGGGELVDTDDHPDLLWLLRGGKYVPGVITEVRVRLVPLPQLYAGSLVFGDVEAALRGWIAWTHSADPRVTTSVAIGRNPDLPTVPEVIRGAFTLTLRFAFPGTVAEGERLAAPVRALAPVLLDRLAALPAANVADISHDPTDPVVVWTSGHMATHADDTLASIVLAHFGEAAHAPFVGFEMRHIGAASERDIPGGSAVGGRANHFAFGVVGLERFACGIDRPRRRCEVTRRERDLRLRDGTACTREHLAWTERTRGPPQQIACAGQLAELRHRDPAQCERRRIVAQCDPLQRREWIAIRERTGRRGEERVHAAL
jgi:FAD/FMN-containing dehydrogenase